MRIVYCFDSISYLGGIQRVLSVKANALAEIEGNIVYVIVTDNIPGTQIHPLSQKVHLIDLGINYYDKDTERSRWVNALVYMRKRRSHRRKLKKVLKTIEPDIVISMGGSEKYMLATIKGNNWKRIREFHTERFYRRDFAVSVVDKILAHIIEFYDFSFRERRYDKIVVLSKEDLETNWRGWNNVVVIPNPVSFVCDEPSELREKKILAIGRLEYVKNFSSLIRSFKKVSKKYTGWTLDIYGVGSQQEYLNEQIQSLDLVDRVRLMGYTNDVMSVLKESSVFCLSSIGEGFALVLVEAMECGVPVVSYQCPCGPKDIITDGKDGFLVPVGDEQMMADRICKLIEDEALRRKMGAAAKETAKQYHINEIAKRWMSLFEALLTE